MTRSAQQSEAVGRVMAADSFDLVIARRLLDQARLNGFRFRRAARGPDGPLIGTRQTDEWLDTIHIAGFSRDCSATRERRCSLIVPGDGLVERRADGSALSVLNAVLTWPKADQIAEQALS